jgi:hypothetical protein
MISSAKLDFPTFPWPAVPLREIALAPGTLAMEIPRMVRA